MWGTPEGTYIQCYDGIIALTEFSHIIIIDINNPRYFNT